MYVKSNGDKEWSQEGKLHRTDGPAVEGHDGSKRWFVNGKLHRTDGPAIELADGGKEWWVEGERHRTDGPACECADGSKQWWIHSKWHRTDGPAIERSNGTKEWWIENNRMTEAEFNAYCQSTKNKSSAKEWTIAEVQTFLLAMTSDQVPADIMQCAAEAAAFHKIDGHALVLLTTLDDVRRALGITCNEDCVKVQEYIQGASSF